MPSVIMVYIPENPGPDVPGRWTPGQLVAAIQQAPAAQQYFFNYYEMPVIADTTPLTVEALNNRNQNSYKKFTAFTLLNSGLIDVGLNNLEVEADDIVVRQNDGIFAKFPPTVVPQVQQRAIPVPVNTFHHFEITDLDQPEAAVFVQPVYDNSDPPVLISRSKYRVTDGGLDILAQADGWLEGPWANFEPLFIDEYP